jgi:hypothetical protein
VTATLGRHAASANVMVREREVRRSVTVVGRLPRSAFATSEVWIHPNGTVAYLGTHMGGDRVYAIDISNPGNPVVVDSIMANTRLVNDMQTTPDGNYMVFTREGAADRKNGIVIADTHDPLHPKEISQFTDGVAGGVHSIYIYEHPEYGRFVYLTNDGTGAIDIVNLSDPAKPVRAGEWHTDRPDAARYVHDLDIVDGLLYASYWNDGLVILDIRHWSPSSSTTSTPSTATWRTSPPPASPGAPTPRGGSGAGSTSSSPTRSISTGRSRAPRTRRPAGCTAPCR